MCNCWKSHSKKKKDKVIVWKWTYTRNIDCLWLKKFSAFFLLNSLCFFMTCAFFPQTTAWVCLFFPKHLCHENHKIVSFSKVPLRLCIFKGVHTFSIWPWQQPGESAKRGAPPTRREKNLGSWDSAKPQLPPQRRTLAHQPQHWNSYSDSQHTQLPFRFCILALAQKCSWSMSSGLSYSAWLAEASIPIWELSIVSVFPTPFP